jgi:hypothetical protein
MIEVETDLFTISYDDSTLPTHLQEELQLALNVAANKVSKRLEKLISNCSEDNWIYGYYSR